MLGVERFALPRRFDSRRRLETSGASAKPARGVKLRSSCQEDGIGGAVTSGSYDLTGS